MPLRKVDVDGELVLEIPDDEWLCPKCGAGYEGDPLKGTGGLILEEPVGAYPPDLEHPEGYVVCHHEFEGGEPCGWVGTVQEVFDAALERRNLVPCSCCNGTGFVTGG